MLDPKTEGGIRTFEQAWAYLVLQRGAISDMRADHEKWMEYYCDMLWSEYESIAPYLPEKCVSILDIGSGLGGIDILLNRHYGGKVHITLLDGVNDPPVMVQHAKTFNNMRVAETFLHANGVEYFDYIDAASQPPRATRFYDLVISLKSWCFHYSPKTYIPLVTDCTRVGEAKIIVDMRSPTSPRSSFDYQLQMTEAFCFERTIYEGQKFKCQLYTA